MRARSWLRELRRPLSLAAIAAAATSTTWAYRCAAATAGENHSAAHSVASATYRASTSAARIRAVRSARELFVLLLGADNVITQESLAELEPYCQDRYTAHTAPPPDLVVFPRSTADVVTIVKVCSALGLPIIARGSGTSLEGHSLAPHGGCVLDFTRNMASIVAVRPGDLDVTVQPGMTWGDLNEALKPHNLFFPVDPGPGASLGGMCSCGCSGTLAFKYGTMKANVLSLTAVLADGGVVHTRGSSRARKSVAGLDLTSLIVGSEGTLGVVTELTLRLAPLPHATAVVTAAFPDVRSACAAASDMVARGVPIAAIELLDGPAYDIAMEGLGKGLSASASSASEGTSSNSSTSSRGSARAPSTPRLFMKLAGPSAASLVEAAACAQAVADAHTGSAFSWAADAAGQAELWRARKEILWAVQAAHAPSGRVVATTDVCVPLTRLPDLVERVEAASRASSLPVPLYVVGHVADGNVHHFLAYDPTSSAEVREAERLKGVLVEAAIELEGTCTGEHGVGLGKIEWAERELGPGAVGLAQRIKREMDPHGLLNPGKKIPPVHGHSL